MTTLVGPTPNRALAFDGARGERTMGTIRPAFFAVLAGLLALTPSASRAQAPSATPVISHDALSSCPKGELVTIKALIRSPIGKRIFSPAVFVRATGSRGLARVPMTPVAGEENSYQAQIPSGLTQSDFEYYVEAFDVEGNGPARVGGPDAPIQVKLATASPPPPAPGLEAVAENTAGSSEVAIREPSAPARRWMRTAGIVGVSAGAALLIGGVISGGLALGAKSDMENATTGAQYDSAKTRGEHAALAANVLVPTGAVIAAAGTALWLIDWKQNRDAEKKTVVQVSAGPAGAMVLMTGHF